jgi:hypothetical protein
MRRKKAGEIFFFIKLRHTSIYKKKEKKTEHSISMKRQIISIDKREEGSLYLR